MLDRIRKAQQSEAGFTLIELLVVIIIIGILAAIAIPVFLNQRRKGYDAGAKADMRNVATLEETYLSDNGAYTATLSNLTDYQRTAGVLIALNVSANGQSYCIASYNAKGQSTAPTPGAITPTGTFVYDSNNGGAAATSCSLPNAGWSAWS